MLVTMSFYQVTDGLPKVTCAWDLPLESRVVETWEAVALEYSGEALCVEMHHNVRSRGYEIYHPGARAIWNVGYRKNHAELAANPARGVLRRKKENPERGESDSSDYETISNY